MIKVNSSQFNYKYGDQIHFPYSIASLVGYIQSKEELGKQFSFEKSFVFRDNLEENIQECRDSDILLCACYVWNWEITIQLAREVKKINPNCLVIFGGPQIPGFSEGFFEKYPFLDIIVHGEGEHVLENILKEYLENKNYLEIKGIETKEFRNPPQERINDLDSLPSPYLTNTVWKLVDKVDGIKWIASWETNRGCPYQCSFCDWGSATFTKMRKWEESRLFKEIEWFADNEIPYIDCCDANFGIYQDRDMRLAKKLKEVALAKHFPERIRPAWAKNSSEKIIPIAKQLQEGGILGAVTLAVQSLDPSTLEIIKRANIKFDKFADLTTEFKLANIPTYTEIIIGLPGETLETFKKGLEDIAKTKIGIVFIYNCGVLPNAPMNVPEYREKYKIKTMRSPIMLVHSSIHGRDIQEFEEIVVGTSTCSKEDIYEVYMYSWVFLTLHSLGILKQVSEYYNQVYKLPFMEFYETFLEFSRSKESIFSDEVKIIEEYRDGGYTGKGWDHHDPNLGDINWPIEEASWLRLSKDASKLESSIGLFLKFLEEKFRFNSKKEIMVELAKFQVFLLITKSNNEKIKRSHFEYDWKNFFVNGSTLSLSKNTYHYSNLAMEEDPIKWNYKVIWYGRRSHDYKCEPEDLNEENSKNKIEKEIISQIK
jgi:radical SAM superfamily enzyme YgiQ (UPF0313 family)